MLDSAGLLQFAEQRPYPEIKPARGLQECTVWLLAYGIIEVRYGFFVNVPALIRAKAVVCPYRLRRVDRSFLTNNNYCVQTSVRMGKRKEIDEQSVVESESEDSSEEESSSEDVSLL